MIEARAVDAATDDCDVKRGGFYIVPLGLSVIHNVLWYTINSNVVFISTGFQPAHSLIEPAGGYLLRRKRISDHK